MQRMEIRDSGDFAATRLLITIIAVTKRWAECLSKKEASFRNTLNSQIFGGPSSLPILHGR